jgi:hypothetical protein
MEHIKNIEKRIGVDVGYHSSNIQPIDKEVCVGKRGINKSLTFEEVLEIAYKIDCKPNIIIKAGKNAKWYLKKCQKDKIEESIEKQKWRDTSRCIMYIIEWELDEVKKIECERSKMS